MTLAITDWSAPLNALFDAVVLFSIVGAVWAVHLIRKL